MAGRSRAPQATPAVCPRRRKPPGQLLDSCGRSRPASTSSAMRPPPGAWWPAPVHTSPAPARRRTRCGPDIDGSLNPATPPARGAGTRRAASARPRNCASRRAGAQQRLAVAPVTRQKHRACSSRRRTMQPVGRCGSRWVSREERRFQGGPKVVLSVGERALQALGLLGQPQAQMIGVERRWFLLHGVADPSRLYGSAVTSGPVPSTPGRPRERYSNRASTPAG